MIGSESADYVCVFCRIRPPDSSKNNNESNEYISIVNSRTLHTCPPPRSAMTKSGTAKECDYLFTKIFDPSVNQEKVFMEVAYPLVKELLNFRNGLIFTYGVTGSGKTHTMQGKPKTPGMLPRVLDTIFNSIGDRQTKKYVVRPDRSTNEYAIQSEADAMMERQQLEILSRHGTPSGRNVGVDEDWLREIARVTDIPDIGSRAYAVFVSYVEIYNNYVYDLLDELFENPVTGARAPQSKSLREDYRKMMFVCGSTEIEVKSAEEAYAAFLRGRRRRKVAHTVLNTESSRSHSIFTIRLVSVGIDNYSGEVILGREQDLRVSQLSLVDLAGSERSQRTGNSAGERMREAGNINNTLMTLRKCIENLRNNQVVPYRDSRLTHLFKSYFEGGGRVRVLVCISTKPEEFDETINVLKFAEESAEVRIRVVPRTPNSTRKMPPPPSPSLNAVRKIGTPLVGMAATESSDSSESEIEGVDEEEMLTASSAASEKSQAFVNSLSWLYSSISEVESCDELITQIRESQRRRVDTENARSSLINLLRERIVVRRRNKRRDRRRAGDAEEQATRVRQEKAVLERRVRSLEQKNDKLARNVSEIESEKKALIDANGDLTARVKREIADRQRMKDLYQAKLQLSQQQFERHGDFKDKKVITPRPPTAPKPRTGRNAAATPLSGGSNVRRLRQNFSPPPPHANPRYQHRRSRSADERWVDHHSKNEVPTGTVLQPSLGPGKRKRKSVTHLEAKEVSTATNYVLTHQQADEDGNLETHLFKANVIPTVGGGAAVVFNDIESLTQADPQFSRQARKRSISQPIMKTDSESEDDVSDENYVQNPRMKRVKESMI